MTALRHMLCLAISLGAVALLTGCGADGAIAGYSGREMYPENVRTVAVPIFENNTFEEGVEFGVTEAVTKEIELRTPYKVAGSGAADTQLTGTIRSVSQRMLSRTYDGGLAQEVQVVIVASFEWKDMRTGEVIRKRGEIRGTGEYIPARAPASADRLSEPMPVGVQGATGELAREIVSVMRQDW